MLPAIYRIYGLSWPQVADMPRGELLQLLDDLALITTTEAPGG